ncbi:MAG: zinc ribbon domain-containing protein [Armatimonadota bacterium]|nr:zinc ribbon domain-containing protein [Armatimonadota bacterium]MDR5702582.1 zinc ribbon domain-containing protein [Armatimonadota bacterium]MDR7433762.1 zinc ribbon domain-containing protein [Armatimonadota bacterium]
MPIYEYRCTQCGAQFEVFQSVHDGPVTACERCGGPVKRVYSPVGLIFKGPGFHVTDYRKGPKEEGTKKEERGTSSEDSPKKDS